jgi:hypothetical protein
VQLQGGQRVTVYSGTVGAEPVTGIVQSVVASVQVAVVVLDAMFGGATLLVPVDCIQPIAPFEPTPHMEFVRWLVRTGRLSG